MVCPASRLYHQRTMKTKNKKADIQTIMAAIVLDGFQREVGDGLIGEDRQVITKWGNNDYSKSCKYVRLSTNEIVIAVNFDIRNQTEDTIADGHVWFKAGDTWFTFDRRGFEDSFYLHHPNATYGEKDLAKILAEQVERAQHSIKEGPRQAVPGTYNSIHITLSRRLELTQDLLAGKIINLSPGGMGTGYQVATSSRGMHHAERDAEMAKFFGVHQCYKQTYDHD